MVARTDGHDEYEPLLGKEADQTPHSWSNELITLWKLCIPMWCTNMLEYGVGGVTVVFVGRLGIEELNAISVAQLTLTTFVISGLIFGPCTALDTLCNQAYTSSNPKLTSLYVQRTGFIIFLALIPASIFLWFKESMLLAVKQDPYVAHLAGKAIRVLLAQTPFIAVFEMCKRWLLAQGIVRAPTYVAAITAPTSIILTYLLVLGPDNVRIGFMGAPIASLIVQMVACISTVLYCLLFAPRTAWGGWSAAIFHDLGPNIRLGLAGSLTTMSEWLSWDLVSFSSSYLGSVAFGANQMSIFTTAFCYQLPLAIMIAGSIRVGNTLGAQQPATARFAAKVAWVSGLAVGVVNATIVLFFRHQLAHLFTEDPEVIIAYGQIAPFVASLQIFDDLTGACYGILRGSGLASLAAKANILAYWFVGIPLGFTLAFHLNWRLQGLWTGHVTAMFLTALLTTFFCVRINWQDRAQKAAEQTAATEAGLRNHTRAEELDAEI